MARIYHTWHGFYPGPEFVTDGLVAHWDAGNTSSYPGSGTDWFDLTANGNDGVLTNGPVYSSVGGDHIEFDGDNDYVELGSIDSSNPLSLFGSTALSIEIWLNPETSGDDFQRIFDKNTAGASIGGYGVYTRPSLGQFVFNINGTSVVHTPSSFAGWKQIVWKRSSSNSITFVLNTLDTPVGSLATSIPSTTASARIGSWSHSTGREFKGKIGCVRIYNKELSPSEILLNYNQLKGRYGLS